MVTPRLMGKAVSPLLAAGKFLLAGCWISQAMGSSSAYLPAWSLGSSSAREGRAAVLHPPLPEPAVIEAKPRGPAAVRRLTAQQPTAPRKATGWQ